ncbi:SMI1/KNR4 family protein [Carboxylicivirga taeanensis]|uniref:SMI1/KNR4 family protein n=1 Tax=Carboxylicivirga taeanensis TaxID=1416875 RepID=UPI003F6E3056
MPFPVEEKYIVETENEIGLKFPDSFRDKMKRENGGELIINGNDWTIHPFFDKTDRKRISRTSNHIIYETKEAKNWREFPKNAIVIGSDSYGNKLILLPKRFSKKKLQDIIYEWNHETGKINKVFKSTNEIK